MPAKRAFLPAAAVTCFVLWQPRGGMHAQPPIRGDITRAGDEKTTPVHFRSLSLTSVHFRSLSFTFVHFRSLSFTFVHFRPLSFTLVHYRPRASAHIHARPHSPSPVRTGLRPSASISSTRIAVHGNKSFHTQYDVLSRPDFLELRIVVWRGGCCAAGFEKKCEPADVAAMLKKLVAK